MVCIEGQLLALDEVSQVAGQSQCATHASAATVEEFVAMDQFVAMALCKLAVISRAGCLLTY